MTNFILLSMHLLIQEKRPRGHPRIRVLNPREMNQPRCELPDHAKNNQDSLGNVRIAMLSAIPKIKVIGPMVPSQQAHT